MAKITDPIQIGSLELKNRYVLAPMVSNHCDEQGYVTPRVLDTYDAEARGGVGLVQTMAFWVHPTSTLFRAPGIEHDGRVSGIAELAYTIHRGGAKASLQLVHGGPLVPPRPGQPALGPSPMESAFAPGSFCKEMDEEEIEMIIEAFGQAAARAQRAGFDAVNVHSCHGSLIQLFMSPGKANRRQDRWGQDPLLFPLRLLESVRQAVGPAFPIIWRISGDEFYGDQGYNLQDVLHYAPALEQAGVDCFDVSAGRIGLVAGSYIMLPLYRPRGHIVYLAEAIKGVVNVPVITVGKIMDPRQAEKIVEEGRADLVALGRPIWADPDYVRKALEGRPEDIRRCISCNFCMQGVFTGTACRCAVNAEFGREARYRLQRADISRRVLVVGGGVAGMEAARVAALRGHPVTLYERSERLGGLVNLASAFPRLYTRDLHNIVDYLEVQVRKLGIRVELGQEVNLELIRQEKPDVVLLACGSSPLGSDLPGLQGAGIVSLDDYLAGRATVGERVVILGGNEGAEAAVSLAREKKEVTLVEPSETIASPFYLYDVLRRGMLLEYLQQEEVKILTRTRPQEVRPGGAALEVWVTDEAGQSRALAADTVLVALGRQPNRELAAALQGQGIPWHELGDCVEPRSIAEAIDDAAYICRFLV